jgi:hypothetical protein
MMSSNRTSRFILNIVLLLTVSVVLFGGLALTVSAQIPPDYGLEATAKAANLSVGNPSPAKLAATIINALLGFLGVILVILIIYAGFIWMTATGDEQKIGKAKKLLGSSIVGLAIVLASYAIASFTISTLEKGTGASSGGNNQTQTCSGVGGYCAIPPCTPNTDIGKYDCQGIQTCCKGSGT